MDTTSTCTLTLGAPVPTASPLPGWGIPATVIPLNTIFGASSWAASPNLEYILIMQGDGNLVLYKLFGQNVTPAQGATLNLNGMWSTKTQGNIGAVFEVKIDGNLVVYSSTLTDMLWTSNTSGVWSAGLYLQNDGNLVLYGLDNAWATGTNS